MSLNLIQQAKDLFSGDVVNQASTQLGESPSAISTAIAGIVPTIFAGLISKTETAAGSDMVANLASSTSNEGGGLMDNIAGMLGGSGSGASVLNSIFGSAGSGISDSISKFAGLKAGSAQSLMGMVGTAVLGFLGKYISKNEVGASGLSALLSSQKAHVAAAMPAGLNLGAILGATPAAAATTNAQEGLHSNAATSAHHYAQDVDDNNTGGGLQWLLPVLLLALLGAGALYYFKGCKDTGEGVHGTNAAMHSTMHEAGDSSANMMNAGEGTVDADGNYIYELGEMTEIALPNGGGSLKVGQNSTEAKLVRFLQGSEMVDTAKGNWFDFTNVYFNTGKSTITESSMSQLMNMAAIAKAFPKAQFKIGGYTDNTGNEASNVTLSKSRAAIVAAKLKEMGATNISSADGYGSQFAIADNGTVEGKAQNRRVSVNVKSK